VQKHQLGNNGLQPLPLVTAYERRNIANAEPAAPFVALKTICNCLY